MARPRFFLGETDMKKRSRKRKLGKAVALVLAGLLVIGTAAYFVGGANAPRAATGYRKALANVSETIVRGVRGAIHSDNDYTGYTPLAEIPEVENGYVPQGYCYCEALESHVVSYYHDDGASVLSFVDDAGARTKTLRLQNADQSDFTGHAGGLADSDRYLYLCSGDRIYRFALEALRALPDGGTLTLDAFVQTDVRCSYIHCDGTYLYAGEFYTYYPDERYGTDATHHMQMTMREVHFSRCNAYALGALDAAFQAGNDTVPVPAFALTTPNLVQGLARTADGGFALSTSYGRNTDSHLLVFDDVTRRAPAYYLTVPGGEAPVYALTKDARREERRLPPLLEGIDWKDGAVVGIFESGAQKYSDGKFPLNSICRFA